ncbi:hypothetical protein V1521DRAFT_440993 [Lipomyces starkeyi]
MESAKVFVDNVNTSFPASLRSSLNRLSALGRRAPDVSHRVPTTNSLASPSTAGMVSSTERIINSGQCTWRRFIYFVEFGTLLVGWGVKTRTP